MKQYIIIALIIGFAAFASPAIVCAQVLLEEVQATKDTGVEPKLGVTITGDLNFTNSDGANVRWASLFDGKRPVVLSFNYSDCPGLCSVQLENMTLALSQVDLSIGKDFQVVSVSIDPNEQLVRLKETKRKYTGVYNRDGAEKAWHFLKGDEKTVLDLAAQCGVKYKYIPHQKLFSHPPVFLLISPENKIVRYIYGLDYDGSTVKAALVESAAGKIGSPINYLAFMTGCYQFDEHTGRYSPMAMGIMRLGGILTVIGLVVGVGPYLWWRNRGRQANSLAENQN
jgi:protein SCO1/2